MSAPRQVVRAFSSFVAFGGALLAQDLRLLDGSRPLSAAFDTARNRLVTLGSRGDTREFDGSQWHLRAVPLLDVQYGALVYDTLRHDVVLVGASHEWLFAQHRYDGVQWQAVVTAATPSLRQAAAMAFDVARNEVVLFGGESPFGGPPLAETWVFDGTNWLQRAPVVSPPARARAGIANDEMRGRIVLFGGGTPMFPRNDTWEWDGANWQQVLVANRPSARVDPSVTYDSLRGRVVLFGGGDLSPGFERDDVWDYDGNSWQQVATTNGPSPRVSAAAVFDAVRGESVFVGGYSYSNQGELFDAWLWDGTRWLAQPAAPRPAPPRYCGACFADPLGNGLIRFGGWSGTSMTGETRRWDGWRWIDLVVPGPSPRWAAATCAIPGAAFLFGGEVAMSSMLTLGDLWRFDGLRWTRVAASGPSARAFSAMAFDIFRGEIVLFGGSNAAGYLDDTWVFDGTNWLLRQPATVPPSRDVHGMVCDLSRAKVVMFGGQDGPFQLRSDTWEWDGVDWASVATTHQPPGGITDLAFDVQRLKVVASNPTALLPLSPLWEYDGVDWQQLPASLPFLLDGDTRIVGWPHTGVVLAARQNLFSCDLLEPRVAAYGTACGAAAPALAVATWPRLGAAGFGIEVVRAPAGAMVALLGAVQPANVLVGACTQLVQPGQAVLLLGTSPGGVATMPLQLPANYALLGVDLFFQAAALAASAPGGFVLSRGLQITLGN